MPLVPFLKGHKVFLQEVMGFFFPVWREEFVQRALRQEGRERGNLGTEHRTAHSPELILFKHPQVPKDGGQVSARPRGLCIAVISSGWLGPYAG